MITVIAVITVVTLVTFAQEPLPRFRSGANLVTVDAYFAKDGTPVADLKPDEIEIIEDDHPQRIESIRVVNPRGQGLTRSKPDPGTAAESRAAAADPESRLFVLFFDNWHVSFEGSAKAATPVSELLNRVIGANDLVGVTAPDMPARTLALTRKTDAIDRVVRDTTNWGQRDRIEDPREREIFACYPDNDPRRPQFRGIAKEMIERRREQKSLQALDELITHLATLRDERKFVVLLSEGWVLFRQNERLAAILEPESIPGPPPSRRRERAHHDRRGQDEHGLRPRLCVVRARAIDAGVSRSHCRDPPARAARQSRQRDVLRGRPARTCRLR